MLRSQIFSCVAVLASLLFTSTTHAALRLPAVISDHMVLQAGQSDAIWGWAAPGDQISIAFLDSGKSKTLAQASATAGSDGKWMAHLPPPPTGTPGVLSVTTAAGEEKLVDDVLVGEVWLGSGQSNMQYTIQAPATTPEVGAAVAKNIKVAQDEADKYKGLIRDFLVPPHGMDTPQDDVVGAWRILDSSNVGHCSAVAWNFAVALHEKLNVPVGIITSSVGATPVEAWTSKEALLSIDPGRMAVDRNNQFMTKTPEELKQYEDALAKWKAAYPTPELRAHHTAEEPPMRYGPTSNKVPTRLYNGMINGLIPYTIQGIIWFQSDTLLQPDYYGDLITNMVESWRKKWGAVLPFYYVEFNNWHAKQTDPVQTNPKDWLSITREQQQAVLKLPKTGVATSVDLGDVVDPHFPDKKPVGERLAALALADIYHIGDPNKVRSPEYTSADFNGGEVRLHFKYADGLRLISGNDSLKGFAICGPDNKWICADGKIDGQDIVVSSPSISHAKAVWYAWADNPILSVENQYGLPLRPFRTDAADRQRIAVAKDHRDFVWKATKPNVKRYLDVPYVDDGDEHHTMDIYVPPGDGPFPLIFTIHGGGWAGGDKETPGVDGARTYCPAGFVVASPEYRFITAAAFPAQIEDVNAALQYLRSHAAQYHIDPTRVGVWGHSAGAHLAELMGVTGDSPLFNKNPSISTQVQAVVSWAGPADLTRETGKWPAASFVVRDNPKGFLGTAYSDDLAKLASPAYHIHPGLPPFLLVHGEKDQTVPVTQSIDFDAALKTAGIGVTLDLDPNLDHAIGRNPQKAKDALAFFQRVLKPAPSSVTAQ